MWKPSPLMVRVNKTYLLMQLGLGRPITSIGVWGGGGGFEGLTLRTYTC